MREVRLLAPDMPDAGLLLPYLKRIDLSGRYTNFGPLSRELELELAAILGAPEVVTAASGTVALELTLASLGLPPGGEVLVPAHTFPATATAIMRAGLTPVLADVDPETGLLSSAIARAAAARRLLAAVVPVALYGRSQDTAAWDRFSGETGIPVAVDAAGAIACQSAGRRSHAVFSLHATKPLAAGEGGLLATADPDLAGRVRSASNFGFAGGIVHRAGTNGKLSEYHAAVALAALDGWRARLARRRQIFEAYVSRLAPLVRSGRLDVFSASGMATNLVLRLCRPLAPGDEQLLAGRGIGCRRWYWPPLDRHPAFASCPVAGRLDGVAFLADRLIGVPFHLGIGEAEIARVAEALEALSP